MHYVTVDGSGSLTGFYDDTLAAAVPFGAFSITEAEWLAWRDDQANYRIIGGVATYVPPPPPVISLDQQATDRLNSLLALGITITSDSTPDAINAAYALDPASTAQIFQIGLFAAQFGVFPSGGNEIAYPDVNSDMHPFSVEQFVAFLRAVAPLVSKLTMQAGAMRAGGTPIWPDRTATIP